MDENKKKYCFHCAKRGHFGHVSIMGWRLVYHIIFLIHFSFYVNILIHPTRILAHASIHFYQLSCRISCLVFSLFVAKKSVPRIVVLMFFFQECPGTDKYKCPPQPFILQYDDLRMMYDQTILRKYQLEKVCGSGRSFSIFFSLLK